MVIGPRGCVVPTDTQTMLRAVWSREKLPEWPSRAEEPVAVGDAWTVISLGFCPWHRMVEPQTLVAQAHRASIFQSGPQEL